jgi:arylsulfatase A-like enzyme
LYSQYSEGEQHYYGCVTAMDEQVGRLNQAVKDLGQEDHTLIWFCSDNGPEGLDENNNGRNRGSTGGLTGRKRSLFNGGIAVPGLIKWPKYIPNGTTLEMPCSTLDFFPTLVEETEFLMPDNRPIDGVSLLPYFKGRTNRRPKPIPFRFVSSKSSMFGSPTFGLIDNEYKLLTNFSVNTEEDMMFNLINDPYEQDNRISLQKDLAEKMKAYLVELLDDFRRSHYGNDYSGGNFRPVNEFICNEQGWTGN